MNRETSYDRVSTMMPEREWKCRTCGAGETGRIIPRHWYGIHRYPGIDEERPSNLGLYCSASCMTAAMPSIEHREQDLGNGWSYFPRT